MSRYIEVSDAVTENVKVSKEIFKLSQRAEGIWEQLSVGMTSIDETLLQLLSPLEPLKRHADVKSMRLENTGTWLLGPECFRKWCDIKSTDGSERILCCYGIPGPGKTMIRYFPT